MSSELVTLRDWYESKFRPTLKMPHKLLIIRDRAIAEFEKATKAGILPDEINDELIAQFVERDQGRYEINPETLTEAFASIDPARLPQLGVFLQAYVDHRADSTPDKLKKLRKIKARLIEYFGADRSLATITRSDAAAWLQAMGKKRAKTTMINYTGPARLFFQAAYRANLIPENPFDNQRPEARLKARRQLPLTFAKLSAAGTRRTWPRRVKSSRRAPCAGRSPASSRTFRQALCGDTSKTFISPWRCSLA